MFEIKEFTESELKIANDIAKYTSIEKLEIAILNEKDDRTLLCLALAIKCKRK